jgi:beta-glucosidase
MTGRLKRNPSRFFLSGAALIVTSLGTAAAKDVRAQSIGTTDDAITARADALIAQMTPEEKAGQLTILFNVPMPPKPEDEVAAGRAGGLLFVSDPKEANRLQRLAIEKTRLKIPLLLGFDVVHGLKTSFPVPIGNAASWDPAGVERIQSIAALEARAVGIHLTFAPMVDIARDPRWGRIVEGAGEDPYLGSAMAAAQVRGFQGAAIGAPGHIIAGPKHFAGYGAALGGRDYDEVNLSDSELWNVYLPPFKAAVDASAGNVMSAYMGLNGVPATGNRWLLTDVLRNTWGFKGFVVSDADAVKNLTTHGFAADSTDASARAIDAGLDMEMSMGAPASVNLPKALVEGRLTVKQLDAAVRHVLEAKIRMGLFEHPYVDEKAAERTLADPSHLVEARLAGERAAVLLRNEGGLLPLDRKGLNSIAVIGPLADSPLDALGPWVFTENKPPMSSILQGIRDMTGPAVHVEYAIGVGLPDRLVPSPSEVFLGPPKRPQPDGGDTAGIGAAVELARRADVAVLVLGEAQNMIGESAARSSLKLPGRQKALLDAVTATGKPVVVVLMSGRPLDLQSSKAQAVLDIWYPGSAAGTVVANLLFGKAVPGGKLPFTWPRNVGQVPMIYSHLASHAPADADRRYWNESGEPAWPFGFGLSYSSFAFSNLAIDKPRIARGQSATVTVDLKNVGAVTADEVAQLYIHQRSGTAARPVRELKGFQRVTLKPGETRKLTFSLGEAELRYWNANRRDWVVDDAVFDFGVGADSTAKFGGTFATAWR